jgi:hypothetical protein
MSTLVDVARQSSGKSPGFVPFHLLKGPEAEDHTLYASHTVWENPALPRVALALDARSPMATLSKPLD